MTAFAKVIIIFLGHVLAIFDNTSGGHTGYRAAEVATSMIGKSLAGDLAADRIAMGMIHPGVVLTAFSGDIAKQEGQRDVEDSEAGVWQGGRSGRHEVM